MAYESLQKKLNRVRAPHVHITYDVEVGDAIEKRELPFVLGVLADLSGKPQEPLPPLRDRRFVEINRDNFDQLVRTVRPNVRFTVGNTLAEDDSQLSIELSFRNIDDFAADAVAMQVPVLNEMLLLRDKLSNLRAALFGNDELEENLQEILVHPPLLREVAQELEVLQDPLSGATPSNQVQRLLDSARVGRSVEDRAAATIWLRDFIQEAVNGSLFISRDTESVISARVAEIDRLVSLQLDEILHHADLQKLEATWRGLWYLVDQSETSARLKIRVLNLSKQELVRDLERAAEFDQSVTFKKVYEEEYGTMGGLPYAVLIGDYYFGREARDVALLERMAQIAASSHAPFLAGAAPEMFNLTAFSELGNPRDLSKIFDSQIYQRWTYFRKSEDARFVGLVLPRLLLRLPYGRDTLPVERFSYEEQLRNHETYLWGNPAFAFGVRLSEAFARYGWFAAIRGVEGGGLIAGLPAHQFLSDDGEVVLKCPTEIAITDRRELELTHLGFIPLLHVKNTDTAVFFSVPSCYKPAMYLDSERNASGALSANLDYVLAVSRFTHYLRCIMRDKIGSYLSA
ncbi:MAG: type VI secretion system contractile sheath large subunit, partial [Acidobacteriota bacterium]|nr:type VI secretion system contractile sheath large subunit [Acidobacteriota bacterium]